jgi:type II secretory pathway pseudopilin PulG
MQQRTKNGFTLIEVLVITTAIAIVATMLTLSYLNVQKQSRDSKRQSGATNVVEGLEQYFNEKGEYPSVATVTNSDAKAVKQALNMPTITSLLGPNAPASSNTNAWKSGAASSTNQLTYSPNTDASPNCQTGVAATDTCADFKVQYYKEETNSVETIYSRNKATAGVATPGTPAAPTVVATLSGTNVLATMSGSSCSAGATLQYSFSSRTNNGAWSADSPWSGTATTTTPATQGVKYDFTAKSRCVNGSQSSVDSPPSTEASYTHPLNAPAPPTLNQSTTGTTTTFSVNTITCAAGATPQVQYHLTTDWGYNGAWTAALSNTGTHIINTTNEGYEYLDEAQARCTNAYTTSDWSASSTASYISPVTAPGGASNYVGTMAADATKFTWSFTRPSCHASVSLAINYNIYVDTGWTVNGASGWTGWRNAIVTNTNTTQTVSLTPNNAPTFSSGGRSALTTEWYCINQTTGRKSTIGPRVQSATYTYTP